MVELTDVVNKSSSTLMLLRQSWESYLFEKRVVLFPMKGDDNIVC